MACATATYCGVSRSCIALSTTGSVKVTNLSTSTIAYLYLSPVGTSTWGPDQLGATVLGSGSSFTMYGVPGGRYDLKASTLSGTSAYSFNFLVVGGYTAAITVQ